MLLKRQDDEYFKVPVCRILYVSDIFVHVHNLPWF